MRRKEEPEIEVGELLGWEDGSIWEVVHVTKGSADVKCVKAGTLKGNGPGRTLTVSKSRAGYKFLTTAEAEEARQAEAITRAQCDDCWSKHGLGEECPTECMCHESRRRGLKKAAATDDEVARVLSLRAGGMGYAAIEKEMGWPDTHGNRPWKIVKAAEKAEQQGGQQ